MDKVAIANYVFYANVFSLQLKIATFLQNAQRNMQIYLALWSIMSNSKGERYSVNKQSAARCMFMRPLCTAILIAIECDCYRE